MAKSSKLDVNILVEHRADGSVLPKVILWNDGRKFRIDKILDVRLAYSAKIGGHGVRYLCKIGRAERVLFDVAGRWCVEQ